MFQITIVKQTKRQTWCRSQLVEFAIVVGLLNQFYWNFFSNFVWPTNKNVLPIIGVVMATKEYMDNVFSLSPTVLMFIVQLLDVFNKFEYGAAPAPAPFWHDFFGNHQLIREGSSGNICRYAQFTKQEIVEKAKTRCHDLSLMVFPYMRLILKHT